MPQVKTRGKKEPAELIRSERDRLRAIFEHLPDGIFITGPDGRIEFMNQELRHQFGNGTGSQCHQFFGLSPINCLYCREAMGTFGPPQQLQWTSLATRRTYEMVVTALPNPDGTSARLHLLRDISTEKQLEQQLRDYSTRLEKLVDEQRSRLRRHEHLAFLGEITSGLAHELRTPLGALLTGIKLLARQDLESDERQTLLALLERETIRLRDKLSQFLAYARAREPQLRPGSVNKLIEEIVELLEHDPGLKGEAEIVSQLGPEREVCCFDDMLLREVLLNIATNGLQAMAGRGTMTFRTFQTEARQWIQVSDNGPGIHPDDLGRIFEPFFSRRQEGSGLGLAIARRTVEDHGGAIEARSIPGRGTTVTMWLPCRPLEVEGGCP